MCVVVSGCGSAHHVPVEGSVSLDGQPVDGGTISFVPEDYKEGGIVKTEIKGGKYSLDKGHGLIPGKYKVVASLKQKTGKIVPSDEPPGTREEVIERMKDFNKQNRMVE